MSNSLAQTPYTFCAEELDAVVDDLVRIVEEVTWSRETIKLRAFAVNSELKRRGYTHARISAAIDRLVELSAIEVIRALPVGHTEHARSEPVFYITTFEQWASLLRDRERRRMNLLKHQQVAPAINVVGLDAEAGDPFADFTRMQRRLLHALNCKGAVPLVAVKRAVYGTSHVTDGALTKLIRRTKQSLVKRGISRTIIRESNTLSLQER
jgi:hypothetical protein